MFRQQELWRAVDRHAATAIALSDAVWDCPEVAYDEWRSADLHAALLERRGFRVTRGIAGIPTALVGEAGAEGPVVAILGEYDALPGLSQEAGTAERKPLSGCDAGHGCGHNLLGAGSLLAAVALKDWLAGSGTPGRVRYYGCPAEEGGAAKTYMVRAGAFADADIAISWHPAPYDGVNDAQSLANTRIDFTFTGRASHAAAAPHLGRSALDAVELMSVGVNYLREHMPSSARVHYAYLDAGGVAPNVVQARAAVRYLIRTREGQELAPLAARVRACAEGAALMTDTIFASAVYSAVSNLLPNPPLEEAMFRNFRRLGPPPWDEADRAFAEAIRSTFSAEDIASTFRRAGRPVDAGLPLWGEAVPLDAVGAPMMGSTDVGDVSWVVPTVQARGATCAIGTPGHSWQLTAQGKSPLAHKGMVHTAKVMAATAMDAFLDPDLVARAKAAHAERTRLTPYVCPLPADKRPPVRPRPTGR